MSQQLFGRPFELEYSSKVRASENMGRLHENSMIVFDVFPSGKESFFNVFLSGQESLMSLSFKNMSLGYPFLR